jgi:hypothetical protein
VSVVRIADVGPGALASVLDAYLLEPVRVAEGEAIPGSYWGEPEAGLVGPRLFLRDDTPVHSAMHEAAHYVCMSPARRAGLDRDAGGDHDEENGVCFLQILLADHIPGMGRARMMRDMDEWGYTFRLGSSAAWFARDAADARRWLLDRGLIDGRDRPTWRLRGATAPGIAMVATR